MKPSQTSFNKAPNKRGGRGDRERTSIQAKEHNPKWVNMGCQNKSFFLKPPPIVRSIVERGKDGKLKRIVSVEEPSLATTCTSK
jgi:hypothetical protein